MVVAGGARASLLDLPGNNWLAPRRRRCVAIDRTVITTLAQGQAVPPPRPAAAFASHQACARSLSKSSRRKGQGARVQPGPHDQERVRCRWRSIHRCSAKTGLLTKTGVQRQVRVVGGYVNAPKCAPVAEL